MNGKASSTTAVDEARAAEAATRLVFACSGAADVGEIADRAARMLQREGMGRMYCLGCIGARIEASLEAVRSATRILAIDGCSADCARKCLEQAGFTSVRHVRITDHQMEKGKAPPNIHNVSTVADRAKHAMLAP
jgi:uncharacterized metal-binding protein